MDRIMAADLDRYITGNYGEDQFRDEDEYDPYGLITCTNCGMDRYSAEHKQAVCCTGKA